MTARAILAMTAVTFLMAACTTDVAQQQRVVVSAESPRVVDRLPDFAGPEELEAALHSFGECVEQSFPIAMRFRVEPFVGLTTDVGSQREDDGDRVDSVVADCMGAQDLDRRLSVYQAEHMVTAGQDRQIVGEFASCVSSISTEISELVAQVDLVSQEDVSRFVSELARGNDDPTGDELIAVSGCFDEMAGPEIVFSDGYPWFTP
jgi:hypothetical protein